MVKIEIFESFSDLIYNPPEEKKVELFKDLWDPNSDLNKNLNESTPKLFNFDINYESVQVDASKLVHPNAPSHWVERKENNVPRQIPGATINGKFYSSLDYAQLYNQTMQARNYLNNRGQWRMNYVLDPAGPLNHPDERKSRAWIPGFCNKMEKALNDPVYMGMPYYQREVPEGANGFFPANPELFETREDKLDNNYYRLKEQQEHLRDVNKNGLQSSGMGSLAAATAKKTGKKKTQEEIDAKMGIRNSITTPSINPKYLDYNAVTKSGEKYWSLGKMQEQMLRSASDFSTKMMSPAERSRALAATMKGYNKAANTDIGTILENCPTVTSNIGTDMYGNTMVGYRPNYISSICDEEGLPTRYFDDNGKSAELTVSDLRKGFGGSFELVDTEDGKKKLRVINTTPDIPMHRVDPGCAKLRCISYHEGENGNRIIDSINIGGEKIIKGEELLKYIDEHNRDEYIKEIIYNDKSRIPTEKEQYFGDDSFFLAKELSRYNEELANALLWYRANAKEEDYKIFIKKCREQLILYRNEDPFCIIKSGVLYSEKIIITKPKPTTLKELEELTKVEEERVKKFGDNIRAKLQLEALKKGTTVEEKVRNLKNVRNLLVIPRDKDLAIGMLEKIFEIVSKPKHEQLNAYHIWKRLAYNPNRDYSDIMANFDKEFDSWWNIPNAKYSADITYADKYNQRMMQLQQGYFDWLETRRIPNNYRAIIAGQRFWKEFNKYSQGMIRPDMSTLEYIQVVPKVYQNMLDEEVRVQNEQRLRRMKTYNPQAYIKLVNQLGQYHEQKQCEMGMFDNPSYTPLYNNPEEYDRRQQLFIEEMFQTRKLGHVL